MKQLRLPLLLALTPLLAFAAPSGDITEAPPVLPKPLRLEITGMQGFSLAAGLPVVTGKDGEFSGAVGAVIEGLAREGVKATDNGCADCGDSLLFKKVDDIGPEAYRIVVTTKGIVIEAADEAGAFYGAQTLVQSVVKDAAGKPAIPAMAVTDAPRFKWRGLMLDSGRHFIKPENVKRMIDLMSQYKFNTLHWHLTEDQGWRIEIKKYPKLTQLGSIRASSPVMGSRNKQDGKPYGPFFYTQDQIRDIVAYAKARSVTIIPEIEMPGHSCAAITAYPELGNRDIPGYAPHVRTAWGVEPYVYAPKEETFKFIDDVLGEVAALFPDAPYIHIGGDECPKAQWNKSPFAQKLMKERSLLDAKGKPDAEKLQSWFIARVEKSVNAHGKKLVGWDEIEEDGLSPTSTVMVWRDWSLATKAIQHGNDVVMTPGSHCYLDHSPGVMPKSPGFEVIGGKLPLATVYAFDPIPKGLTPDEQKHVIGVQGNLWSEYFFNQAKLEYMAFPRALALAEVAWTTGERNEAEFKTRLDKNLPRLDEQKVNYRKDDGSPAQPEEKIVNE